MKENPIRSLPGIPVLLALSARLLPPLSKFHHVAGTVRSGLPGAGVPVVTGAMDAWGGMFGLGVIEIAGGARSLQCSYAFKRETVIFNRQRPFREPVRGVRPQGALGKLVVQLPKITVGVLVSVALLVPLLRQSELRRALRKHPDSLDAYDLLIQAERGLASITGGTEGPSRVGISVVDIATGATAHASILEALIALGLQFRIRFRKRLEHRGNVLQLDRLGCRGTSEGAMPAGPGVSSPSRSRSHHRRRFRSHDQKRIAVRGGAFDARHARRATAR